MTPVTIKKIKKRRVGKVYRRSLPDSWNEIDRDRLQPFLIVLLQQDFTIARIEILKQLLNIPNQVFLSLDDDVVFALINLLEWMKPVKNPVPLMESFHHNGIEYFFPAEKFGNCVGLEYPMSDDFYTSFLNGDEKALLQLTALLCREEKKVIVKEGFFMLEKSDEKEIIKTGDRRVKIHSRSEVMERAKRLEGVGEEIQVAALLYWSGCKEYIYETYKGWIFKKPEQDIEGNEVVEEQDAGDGPMFKWWSIYFTIAEAGIFGNLNDVHQTNFHSLCMYLVDKKREHEKEQRKRELSALK